MKQEFAAGAVEEAVDKWTQARVQPELRSDSLKDIIWALPFSSQTTHEFSRESRTRILSPHSLVTPLQFPPA